MNAQSELGDFLRNRRGALRPEDVGLQPHGTRRRVPGLRREELAILAGVSVTHYTRLEQGQSTNVSDSVLDAIAGALRLTEDECAHLHDLARPVRTHRRRPTARPEQAPLAVRQLLAAMPDVPAVVLDRRNNVLAWNPLGHALLAGHLAADSPDQPSRRPNLTRLLFLDEHTRDLYLHWNDEARTALAALRLVAGRHPEDRQLAELIGQLALNSPEFSTMWARHPVRGCVSGTKHFQHPSVGCMELAFETMQLAGGAGRRMLAYSAEPGTPSEAALRLLAGSLEQPGRAAPYDASAPARSALGG